MIPGYSDMEETFDNILDKCIDRIGRGDSIEGCLADYPEYAKELRPLLEAMLSTRDAYPFMPQASVKQEARQRFNAALDKEERRRQKARLPIPWIFNRARGWAIVATIIVIAFVGYFGINQLISEVTSPEVIQADYNPDGNFTFLISDAANAIDDFQSLNLTVSIIRLRQEDGDWVEFVPETDSVDLTLLKGDLAGQVWKGNVPEGDYSAAILYVSGASGILKSTGETVNINLPGDKLHLDMDFDVSASQETEFVYDITVNAAGSGKYNLLPVAEDSGTGRTIQKVDIKGQGQDQDQGSGNGQEQGQGQSQNQGQGNG